MGALLNWNISFVFVFMCTFYCGVFSSNSYHYKQQHTCKNVQKEFQELNIGDKSLVPDLPVHVAHLAVCHKGLHHPGQRLCCNNGTVDKYHTAANKYLMDSLHSGTAFLKKFLMDKLKDYEMVFLYRCIIDVLSTILTVVFLYRCIIDVLSTILTVVFLYRCIIDVLSTILTVVFLYCSIIDVLSTILTVVFLYRCIIDVLSTILTVVFLYRCIIDVLSTILSIAILHI
ncbi:hypothetical protein LOTGIDRAFT_160156 [Lottia gigantea]|uniref:Uncharacterized protein n=1 Tax=Lottia gigantea TaxID=225164 RepID=V4AGY2_LOTGI|nr:hypothetical protein LOTGIDRAFT_160156 [Lottia gigantea]ESO96167.1 hypothetical protein LOTGIDRAFT_160156 [Lottia gigantea]